MNPLKKKRKKKKRYICELGFGLCAGFQNKTHLFFFFRKILMSKEKNTNNVSLIRLAWK